MQQAASRWCLDISTSRSIVDEDETLSIYFERSKAGAGACFSVRGDIVLYHVSKILGCLLECVFYLSFHLLTRQTWRLLQWSTINLTWPQSSQRRLMMQLIRLIRGQSSAKTYSFWELTVRTCSNGYYGFRLDRRTANNRDLWWNDTDWFLIGDWWCLCAHLRTWLFAAHVDFEWSAVVYVVLDTFIRPVWLIFSAPCPSFRRSIFFSVSGKWFHLRNTQIRWLEGFYECGERDFLFESKSKNSLSENCVQISSSEVSGLGKSDSNSKWRIMNFLSCDEEESDSLLNRLDSMVMFSEITDDFVLS